MLKYLLSLLFVITLSCGAYAQSDSSLLNKIDTTKIEAGRVQATDPDDDFNIFLIVIGVGFIGAALGAVMAGAFTAFLLLGIIVLLTIAGIVSASFLIGLYYRSLKAGFKSLLLILGSLLGIVFGLIIMWIFNHFFHLGMEGYQVLLGGAGGGLMGGFLLGYIIYRLMNSVLRITIHRLRLTNVLNS